jgi:hypothetical protein
MTKSDHSIDVKIEYIQGDLIEVKQDIKYIKEEFLTRREFQEAFIPIRNGVVGVIMLIVTGFVGAIINFFIRKP